MIRYINHQVGAVQFNSGRAMPYDFSVVFYCNKKMSLLCRLQYIISVKIAHFSYPACICRRQCRCLHWNFSKTLAPGKYNTNATMWRWSSFRQYTGRTDRQTDTGQYHVYARLAYALRGNKRLTISSQNRVIVIACGTARRGLQQASNDDVDEQGDRHRDHLTERWRHRRHVALSGVAVAHAGFLVSKRGVQAAKLGVGVGIFAPASHVRPTLTIITIISASPHHSVKNGNIL